MRIFFFRSKMLFMLIIGSYLGLQSYLLYIVTEGFGVMKVAGINGLDYPCKTIQISAVSNVTLDSLDLQHTTPVMIGQNCNIRELHKDTLLAINRASTLECKKEIEYVACEIYHGDFYADYLSNTCPLGSNPAREFEVRIRDESTRPARIFYLLQLHGRAVQQILRLFKAIYHPTHFYYLHVDAHFDYLHNSLLPLEDKYDNVLLARNRYRTMWGGASLLDMVMEVMREALWYIEWEWDYFINLSGADFPIKTNAEITQFLGENLGDNFVKPHNGDPDVFITKQGINYTFLQCDNHMWKLGPRQLPEGIVIDGGSDWVTLHRDFIKYVLTTDDVLIKELKHFYKYTLLPVESFFHTVLRNSIFCHTYVKQNLRIVNWIRKLGCKCQYKHIVDWCGCSPNNLRANDLRKLIDQPEYILFARKFESIVENVVLNMIESYITSEDPPLMNLYTESVYDREFSHGFDTEVLTVFNSLLEMYYVSETKCAFTDDVIREVYAVNKNDIRSGIIIETNYIQIYYTHTKHVVFLNHYDKPERFKYADIGTEWDQKERIFRNYHGILTVQNSPQLSMIWKQGSPVNITVDWYSPSEEIKSHYVLKVEGTWTVAYHNPTLNKPLEPGIWRVEVRTEKAHFISLQFVIFSKRSKREENKLLINKTWTMKDACKKANTSYVNNCVTGINVCINSIWSPDSNNIYNIL